MRRDGYQPLAHGTVRFTISMLALWSTETLGLAPEHPTICTILTLPDDLPLLPHYCDLSPSRVAHLPLSDPSTRRLHPFADATTVLLRTKRAIRDPAGRHLLGDRAGTERVRRRAEDREFRAGVRQAAARAANLCAGGQAETSVILNPNCWSLSFSLHHLWLETVRLADAMSYNRLLSLAIELVLDRTRPRALFGGLRGSSASISLTSSPVLDQVSTIARHRKVGMLISTCTPPLSSPPTRRSPRA